MSPPRLLLHLSMAGALCLLGFHSSSFMASASAPADPNMGKAEPDMVVQPKVRGEDEEEEEEEEEVKHQLTYLFKQRMLIFLLFSA